MHHHATSPFTFIILITYYVFSQATIYIENHYVQDNIKPDSSYVTDNNNALKIRKSTYHLHNDKSNFRKISKNLPTQKSSVTQCPYLQMHSTYSPSLHTIVDYNNVDVADDVRHQFQPLKNLQYQLLKDIYYPTTWKSSPLLRRRENNKQEISKGNINFISDEYQVAIKPKETTTSSDDHLKLTAYVTPSPSNLKMHPNLHHHIPLIIYKNLTIVPHATVNEPSPVTTESTKSFISEKNMQHEKLANNILNYFDNTAKVVTNFNILDSKEGSKQYIYAPSRSSLERELPHSRNFLPYPPSFISITTTEQPILKYKSVNNKVPDFFTHRQFRSLWESYIPSWQIAKMLQKFKTKPDVYNNNNLQTLALARQNKKKIEK